QQQVQLLSVPQCLSARLRRNPEIAGKFWHPGPAGEAAPSPLPIFAAPTPAVYGRGGDAAHLFQLKALGSLSICKGLVHDARFIPRSGSTLSPSVRAAFSVA